jgi:predicted phosphoribosyltransferase
MIDGVKMRHQKAARVFRDRADAGRRLGKVLAEKHLGGELIVLGLPRGGVPVAAEVARALGAPLDVLIVRKIGAPFNPELAVGSVAVGGVTVYNESMLRELGLDRNDLAPIVERERREVARRERSYRGDEPLPDLTGKVVIVADDGAATGATMQAGVEAVRALAPRRVIVALPTGSREAIDRLASAADEVVVLSAPSPYIAVGQWYRLFDQLSDADVTDQLARAARLNIPKRNMFKPKEP